METYFERLNALTRITPDQVQAAYEATGARPATEVFISVDTRPDPHRHYGQAYADNPPAACPIGTVALASNFTDWMTKEGRTLEELETDDFARFLHLDISYVEGFIAAVDGAAYRPERAILQWGQPVDLAAFETGYTDGTDIRDAIFVPRGAATP